MRGRQVSEKSNEVESTSASSARRRESEAPDAAGRDLDPVARAMQAGPPSAEAQASALNRSTGGRPSLGAGAILQMQRHYGNRHVQRVLAMARQDTDNPVVTPEVESAINRQRGGGRVLDSGVRAQMEPAFRADFSGVRVHTDAQADSLNQALSARAFTTGRDIFFRQGEYNPGSSQGKELLAHELTHVVQQGGGPVQGKLTVSQPGDPLEREADSVAQAVMQRVQRQPVEEDEDAISTKADRSSVHRQEETEEESSTEAEARAEFDQEDRPAKPAPLQRLLQRKGGTGTAGVHRDVIQRDGCTTRNTRRGSMGGSVDKGTFPSKVRGSFDVAVSDTHLSIALNAQSKAWYLIWTSIGDVSFVATVDIRCRQVGDGCEINVNERSGSVFSEQDAPASGGISIKAEQRAGNTILALTPRVGAAVGGGGSVGAGVGPYSVGVSFPDSSQNRVQSLGTFIWSCE